MPGTPRHTSPLVSVRLKWWPIMAVVGRLQRDGQLDWSELNDLKRKYELD